MKHLLCKTLALAVLISLSACIKFQDIGDYSFEPNKPVDISNPLLWTIKASCSIKTSDESDTVKGVMKKGTGSLNGQSVGSGVEVVLKNGDTLTISASALASVEITNLGQNTVSAHCGLSAESMEEIEYIKSVLGEEKLLFLQ
jgi:hypothetical protein